MAVYPSLERSCVKSSCLYIEPEFSKMFSQLLWICLLSWRFEKEVLYGLCMKIIIGLLLCILCLINSDIKDLACFILMKCLHKNHKFNGVECRWVNNGAGNSKVTYGRYSYHMEEELYGFNSYEVPDVIGIENSMMNLGIMDPVTYTHAIWVELHVWRRCGSQWQFMSCT